MRGHHRLLVWALRSGRHSTGWTVDARKRDLADYTAPTGRRRRV